MTTRALNFLHKWLEENVPENLSTHPRLINDDRVSGSGVADGAGRRALRQEAGLISAPRLAG
ncbi:DUF768 domain-containing protein [Mesorhizobium sp. B2-4-14]|nr:DUF768 domain-containing protein [Mesorhizobium sp. B2-4-14]